MVDASKNANDGRVLVIDTEVVDGVLAGSVYVLVLPFTTVTVPRGELRFGNGGGGGGGPNCLNYGFPSNGSKSTLLSASIGSAAKRKRDFILEKSMF